MDLACFKAGLTSSRANPSMRGQDKLLKWHNNNYASDPLRPSVTFLVPSRISENNRGSLCHRFTFSEQSEVNCGEYPSVLKSPENIF